MRRAALLAGVATLVLSLSACDSGDRAPNPAAFSDTEHLVSAVLAGMAQSKTTTFATQVAVGSVQTKGQGQARFDSTATALSAVLDFFGESWEIRLVDQTLYVKAPGDAAADKPWIKAARDGNDPFSQTIGASLDQLVQQSDPRRMLDQIKKAGTILGGEQTQLDGSATDHYRIDIVPAKLAEELPAGLSAETVQQARGRADTFGMELWLNDRRLPVQVSLDLSSMVTAAGAPRGAGAKVTVNYRDWGAPVDVQAPPADQIGEATEAG